MNYIPFNRNFLLSISLLFFGLPLWAQDNVIEEVFVTAEKRSESLQETCISLIDATLKPKTENRYKSNFQLKEL